MNLHEGLLVGLRKQLAYPSVWVVFALGGIVAAAAGLYLIRSRRWSPLSTALSLGWMVLFISLTWRQTDSDAADFSHLWGRDSYLGVLFSADGWRSTASEIIGGGPYVVANTLVLMPLGTFLYLASRRVWLTAVVCVVLVAAVEIQQSLLVTTHEVTDFATNMAGAMAGVAISWGFVRLRRRLGHRVQEPGRGDERMVHDDADAPKTEPDATTD